MPRGPKSAVHTKRLPIKFKTTHYLAFRGKLFVRSPQLELNILVHSCRATAAGFFLPTYADNGGFKPAMFSGRFGRVRDDKK